MKKITFYLLILSVILLDSCGKNFTRLAPLSERSTAEFYETASDFNTAVVGAYNALALKGTYGINYILAYTVRGDNAANGGGTSGLASEFADVDQFSLLTTAALVEDTWADTYKGISRCNIILSRIDGADFDQDLKDQYKGEALFIRSLFYYNLAMIFGNVPLKLEEIDGIDRTADQVSADQVYDQIEVDLKDAGDLLPPSYSGSDLGRATSWAAKSLRGKILLTAGDKSGAATVFKEVIDNGPYELLDNYEDIFKVSNKNNKESVFEVQYKANSQDLGSMYLDAFTINGNLVHDGVGNGNVPIYINQSIIDEFDDLQDPETIRRSATIDNSKSSQPVDWWVPKYDGSESKNLDGDNNWIVMRYADVLLMYAEALGASGGYDYINEVRARVGLGDIRNDPDWGSDSFEEQLLHERNMELAFEGTRWQALVRMGKAKEKVAAQLSDLLNKTVNESDVKLLYPIPLQEIDATEGLNQNPEYPN